MIIPASFRSLYLMPETDLTLMRLSNELDGLMEIGTCLAASKGDVILAFWEIPSRSLILGEGMTYPVSSSVSFVFIVLLIM